MTTKACSIHLYSIIDSEVHTEHAGGFVASDCFAFLCQLWAPEVCSLHSRRNIRRRHFYLGNKFGKKVNVKMLEEFRYSLCSSNNVTDDGALFHSGWKIYHLFLRQINLIKSNKNNK